MPENQPGRVAVYLDFDNIVLSWYDRVHGRNAYSRDRQRIAESAENAETAARLQAAMVDVGAIIDYASSFGTLVLTRAYADWSAPVNAEYRNQLVSRAVDLVQLFPAAAYAKNGADIRLAVDAVEDMFRLTDLTHVVIVAGDSDYVPLAQRVKRLGRYVVGIGVAGSTAKALTAACDEFASYDALPGVERPMRELTVQKPVRRGKGSPAPEGIDTPAKSAEAKSAKERASDRKSSGGQSGGTGEGSAAASAEDAADAATTTEQVSVATAEENATPTRRSRGGRRAAKPAHDVSEASRTVLPDTGEAGDPDFLDSGVEEESEEEREFALTGLLIRALWLSQDKDDSGWLYSSAVKQQMRRMDPSFNEKALGFRSFSEFLKSRANVAELEETGHERLVRLREQQE